MRDSKKPRRTFSVAATITLVYFTAGLLWIYSSELVLPAFDLDADVVTSVQAYKGWFFVSTSAALIYLLSRILTGKIIRSHQETIDAYQDTIDSLLSAIELRDMSTGAHSERVVTLALALAHEIGLPEERLETLGQAALLHDIGKIGVPDDILRKPAELTPGEWVQMRYHAQRGYELLHSVPHLRAASRIVLNHHERWDGSGYPGGLKGKAILLEARIFALVDVWDALISNRPYRKAWKERKAFDYIVDNSGKQFDPAVVGAFVKLKQQRKI
jgi:putative nucleotidyltransferase with HDIG domain